MQWNAHHRTSAMCWKTRLRVANSAPLKVLGIPSTQATSSGRSCCFRRKILSKATRPADRKKLQIPAPAVSGGRHCDGGMPSAHS